MLSFIYYDNNTDENGVGVGGLFLKVVATFSHVGGHHWGCLNNPISSNLGLYAACCVHFMCHHEIVVNISESSFLLSQ